MCLVHFMNTFAFLHTYFFGCTISNQLCIETSALTYTAEYFNLVNKHTLHCIGWGLLEGFAARAFTTWLVFE